MNDKDIISYGNDTVSFVSDVLFEYQQCRLECTHDSSSDKDSSEDTVPIPDKHLSSSEYGARGSVLQSALLPSDAEWMLRVRLPMSHSR